MHNAHVIRATDNALLMRLFINHKNFCAQIKLIISHTRIYQQFTFINHRKCLALSQYAKCGDINRSHYKMENNKPKVIIVGAGAAGIAAACKLYQEGITDVTVLEAEGRLGGRIHSVEFGGSVVDLGAQWCHGERDNIIFEMVKGLDVLADSFNDYHDNTYYESSGKVLNKNFSNELMEIAWNIFEDQEAMIDCDQPFGEYFTER